jgi:hypothetical protein
MLERQAVASVLVDLQEAFREDVDDKTVIRAISEIEQLTEAFPLDERPWLWLGNLRLRLRQVDASQNAYLRGAQSASGTSESRSEALYGLACGHAISGRIEDAREALHAADLEYPVDRAWMLKDNDLERLRSEKWFVDLCNTVSNGDEV